MSHTTMNLSGRVLAYTSHAHPAHHSYSSGGHHTDFLSRMPEAFANGLARAFAWKMVGGLFHGGQGLGYVVAAVAIVGIGFMLWRRRSRA